MGPPWLVLLHGPFSTPGTLAQNLLLLLQQAQGYSPLHLGEQRHLPVGDLRKKLGHHPAIMLLSKKVMTIAHANDKQPPKKQTDT